jgi:predicted TPR repeat methyltransferase
MTEWPESMKPAWFEALYASDPDPWRFATSDYEAAKYDDTLAALGERRFASAFEVGCSIGVLTARLALRCDRLLAVDVADAALERARVACADLPWVSFARMQVPQDWPEGAFDLILFSEVLYYLGPADIQRTAALSVAALVPGGAVLLVHWTGPTNYPVSGDEAAESFAAACAGRLRSVTQARRAQYRLDLLGSR